MESRRGKVTLLSDSSQPFAISVIIPTLNEVDQIGKTIASIPGSAGVEIVVADGGSTDGTVEIALSSAARLVQSGACRAGQMNLAARQARGAILLFLHADTRLPAGFASQVVQTMRNPAIVLGAFELAIDGEGPGLRWIEKVANLRSRRLSAPYGDQAFFVRREAFLKLGGFRETPIMEDYDFVWRARQLGRIAILPDAVLTSARRWNRFGLVRTTLLNWLLVCAFHLGVSPSRLATWYRGKRVRSPI